MRVPECRLPSSMSPPHRDDRPSAAKLPGSCPGTSPLEGALSVCTLLIQNLTFLRALLPWVPESASRLPRPPLPLGQGSPSTGHPSTSLLIPALTILVVHHCSPPPLGHKMVLPSRTHTCCGLVVGEGSWVMQDFRVQGSGLGSPRPECTGTHKVRGSLEGQLMLRPLG